MENVKNNILIIGKNGAATILAKKLAKNPAVEKVFVAPGSNLDSEEFISTDIREDNLTELLKFALENEITLTIPVSEKALNSDIVSFFQTNGQNIFGPTKEACNIALNKCAGKKFLYKNRAQTSKFGVFEKLPQAEDYLKNAKFPITIKCSHYNGVEDRLVCATTELAREFLTTLFSKNNETNVLIEEYTYGHNFTVYYITDGYSALPITACANYKFSENGEGGLLTNGMGCYAPDFKISEVTLSRINNVVNNTLEALDRKGTPYLGILGIECSATGEDKFMVSEFKPFFQDFDAPVILSLISDDLIKIFMACIDGFFADEYEEIKTNDYSSVSAMVTSRQHNKVIKGLNSLDDPADIEFLNVTKTNTPQYLTVKGAVFTLTKTASTLNRARNLLYEDLELISFDGMKYRKDILPPSND
ncbi:MAG: hypothetical protein NC191_08840 [Muribaculaceae bacterium]|nr:hypothetical protein [Muribaculaceae bacterium]